MRSSRSAKQREIRSRGRLPLLLVGAGLALAVRCGGGATSPPPASPTVAPVPTPPPQPLAWRGVPESITVTAGQTPLEGPWVIELVSGTTPVEGASVAAALDGPPGAEIRVTAGSRGGEYLLFVTAEEPGEWRIALRASLAGYEDATAESSLVSVAAFDLIFWRQFVFDAFDCPTASECAGTEVEERVTWVLPRQPDFHILTAGFTSAEVRMIARRIPRAVEQLTGAPFRGAIEMGEDELPRDGRILIRGLLADDEEWDTDDAPCGTAYVGAPAGAVTLNLDCARASPLVFDELLSHELGHALGFFHVDPPHVMQASDWIGRADFTPTEVSHALLAHSLGRGAPYTEDPGGTTFTAHQESRDPSPGRAVLISCYR